MQFYKSIHYIVKSTGALKYRCTVYFSISHIALQREFTCMSMSFSRLYPLSHTHIHIHTYSNIHTQDFHISPTNNLRKLHVLYFITFSSHKTISLTTFHAISQGCVLL
jgi:hypothetical protein